MSKAAAESLGVYVHIPFCVHKCPYCDFNSRPVQDEERHRYLRALNAEIQTCHWKGRPVDTIFFGGGTPSELSFQEFSRLTSSLFNTFDTAALKEWTVECNPGTVSAGYFADLKSLGVNRISLGAQSFSDRLLRRLGRIHSAAQIGQAYKDARKAGFENINLDLIFALPDQSLKDWKEDLSEATNLAPEHLSLYNLIIEPGTEFARLRSQGQLKEAEEDLSTRMMETAYEMSARAGYVQYEISNYCREAKVCLHNMKYWTNRPYLGFGVSAASFFGGTRWTNTGNWKRYQSHAGRQEIPARSETLKREAALGEEIMLRLRLSEGFSPAELGKRYELDIEHKFGNKIEMLCQQNLLERDSQRVRLTRKGLLLASQVSLFFLDS